MRCGTDSRPIPLCSRKHGSKDVSNKNPQETFFFVKKHNNQSLASSYFSSTDDLTSWSLSERIDRDRFLSSFENCEISGSTSSFPIIKCSTSFPSISDLDYLKLFKINSKDSCLLFKGKSTFSTQDMKGSTSSTSHLINATIAQKEETFEPSIESSMPTPSTDEKNLRYQRKGFGNCFFSRFFLSRRSIPTWNLWSNHLWSSRIEKASETTIIDSMIFDDHSKLDLSSICSRSQDDSSHHSIFTDDLSLENWADNSELLDGTFSSFLCSSYKD